MSDTDPLLLAEDNASFWADRYLTQIDAHPGVDAHAFTELSFRYHLLAIVNLLDRADDRAFVAFLCRSAQANAVLRARVGPGADVHPAYLAASDALPYADALVAGDLAAAREIARLAPDAHVEGYEYEDDFLRFHFLHRLLLTPDDTEALEAILRRWRDVLEGQRCPYYAASAALLHRDQGAFDDAIADLVERRRAAFEAFRMAATYDEEIDATLGKVFMHGLALLRFAELRGLATATDYPFMPSLARLPVKSPPPGGSWHGGSRL